MSKFFIENELISSNQSGFKWGDSCVNQLLSITHEIYKSFEEGHEVRGAFPIFSCLARWYNFQINSKQNIRELTKAHAWLFKWEKTMCSSQWSSFHMDKYQCWSTSRFHSWSIPVFNLYKWSLWRTFYECLVICRRYIFIFHYSWQPDFCKCSQQGFINDT